jgi:hypothetical protein
MKPPPPLLDRKENAAPLLDQKENVARMRSPENIQGGEFGGRRRTEKDNWFSKGLIKVTDRQ